MADGMHDFRPIAPYRTFEQVVEQIVRGIRLGVLRVGDRIPSERELATEMQVSRPTLREAIRVLEDVGVIEVRRQPSPGMFVASTNLPPDLLRSKVEMRSEEVRGVLEARRMFEPRVAHLAAAHAGEEDFARMQETIDIQLEMLADGSHREDTDKFHGQDVLFHHRMAGATHNSTIVQLMGIVQGKLVLARDLISHQHHNQEWVIDIHQRTLAAIQRADHALIETVMEEHIHELEMAWERSTDIALVRTLPKFMVPSGTDA
jgi:DNA-binding FadR family transcriptional regulator